MPKIVKVLIITIAAVLLFLLGVRLYFRIPVKDYYDLSEKGFVIPDTGKGFVAQGLEYDKDNDVFLVTGYMKDKSASPIYLVDNAPDGAFKKVLMKTSDGGDFCGHCGGLAKLGDKVYVAGSGEASLVVFSYDDIKNARDEESVTSIGIVPVCSDMQVAFVTAEDDAIYAGEFYREENYPTPDSHKIRTAAGDDNKAIVVGYHCSDGDNSVFGVNTTPFIAYSVPGLVQGMTVKDDRIYLSTSYGTAFSDIYVYDVKKANAGTMTIDGTEVPLYELDSASLLYDMKIPPMSEEIVFAGDRMYTMCESASDKYIFGKFTSAKWCYATKMP